MAIRSGTGGLKYQLPANTDVQQSIAAASSGGSAAASAYGANRQFAANRMRVQADLANSAAERQFRAMSQMGEQQFRAQQNYFDREHSKGSQLEAQQFSADQQAVRLQAQKEGQWQDYYLQTERDRQQQAYGTQQDLRQFNQKQFFSLPEIPENTPPDVRRVLQQNRDVMQNLLGQGWDPNDPGVRDEFKKAYDNYLTGIQSMPKPDPTEEFQRNTFEVDGTRYQKDQKGQYVEVPNSARKEQQKEQDAAAAAQEKQQAEDASVAKGLMKDDSELTAEAAMQKAIKIREGFERGRTPHPPMLPPGAVETLPALPPNTPVPPGVVGTQPALPPNTPVPPGVVVPAGKPEVPPAAPPAPGQPATPQIPGALPEPEVQSIVNDIRSATKDMPIEEGKETPELRSFLEKNLEDIARFQNTPPDQVPEKSRGAVDFYRRYLTSATQGKPIVLRTPEEAAMLPPDTPFVDEQGKPRRTKKKGA